MCIQGGVLVTVQVLKKFSPNINTYISPNGYTVGSCLHYIGHSNLITKFLPSTNILWSWSSLNGNICDLSAKKYSAVQSVHFHHDRSQHNFWNSKVLKLSTAAHPFIQMYTHREVYHYIGYANLHGRIINLPQNFVELC